MLRLFLILLILAGFFGAILFLNKNNFKLDSPIPRVFGISKSPVINDWFPKVDLRDRERSFEKDLYLGASAAIIVDYDSGKILYEKNSDEKLPIASTVKIMTAMVALDNAPLEQEFTVSEQAATIGENSMGLTVAERLTLKDLLYGLMLVSGNDAAITISEGIAGNEEEFVNLMNQKARTIGLSDTHFINATGLDEDGKNQQSTAYEMATLAHFAWENYPAFRKIASTVEQFIEPNDSHKAFDLYNDTNLLTTYPGVRGIKPGYTLDAGLCLVTYAENEGVRLLAVVLGSDDRRGEMKELLDWGFSKFGVEVSHPALDF